VIEIQSHMNVDNGGRKKKERCIGALAMSLNKIKGTTGNSEKVTRQEEEEEEEEEEDNNKPGPGTVVQNLN